MRGVGCFSWRYYYYDTVFCVSVPLRGVGCFSDKSIKPLVLSVSVPLRGVGCFPQSISQALQQLFPSPCGVWVVSNDRCNKTVNKIVSVPLRGVGCFKLLDMLDFLVGVSVPLRGVGCFSWRWSDDGIHCRFPSPCGVWVVSENLYGCNTGTSFRPLAGCGLFPINNEYDYRFDEFPSPCGVWVVSRR